MELFEQIRREYTHGLGARFRECPGNWECTGRMVRQALANAIPAARKTPARKKPQLDSVMEFIDEIPRSDQQAPRKQRHTAHRAHIIETGTNSYRFRRTMEVRQKKKAS